MYTDFGSIITAAVTPFGADGSVNHESFRRLLRHLVDNGSDGIVVCGTTGEGPTLSDQEKVELWRTAVDEVGSDVSVIAGTGTYDTRHTIELSRQAERVGIDGLLVVTPYYNKPPRDGLVAHFTAVADATDLPIMLYNIPARVIVNLEPDLVAELARNPKIVAIKQANPEIDQTRAIAQLAPDLAIYAGNDDLVCDLLQFGSLGGVCVASHIAGPQMREMVQLYKAGDTARARAVDDSLHELYELLALSTNPIPIKAAMNELGHDVGGLRLPLVELAGQPLEQLRERLAARAALASA